MNKALANKIWEHFISHPSMLLINKNKLVPSKRQVNFLGSEKQYKKKFLKAMESFDFSLKNINWKDPKKEPPRSDDERILLIKFKEPRKMEYYLGTYYNSEWYLNDPTFEYYINHNKEQIKGWCYVE